MQYVKNQVCNCTKEELLATSKTVEDVCLICLDEGVHCRVGNHRSGRHPNCNVTLEMFPFPELHLRCEVCFALDCRVCLGGSHPSNNPSAQPTGNEFYPLIFTS